MGGLSSPLPEAFKEMIRLTSSSDGGPTRAILKASAHQPRKAPGTRPRSNPPVAAEPALKNGRSRASSVKIDKGGARVRIADEAADEIQIEVAVESTMAETEKVRGAPSRVRPLVDELGGAPRGRQPSGSARLALTNAIMFRGGSHMKAVFAV